MIPNEEETVLAAVENNHYVEDFIESAKDLYFEGAMRFESLCEQEMLTLDHKKQEVFLKILGKVQMEIEKELDGEE